MALAGEHLADRAHRPRPVPEPAPRGDRRVVDRRALPGAAGPVRRAVPATGPGAVRRLRPAGGQPGPGARLLAAAARRVAPGLSAPPARRVDGGQRPDRYGIGGVSAPGRGTPT